MPQGCAAVPGLDFDHVPIGEHFDPLTWRGIIRRYHVRLVQYGVLGVDERTWKQVRRVSRHVRDDCAQRVAQRIRADFLGQVLLEASKGCPDEWPLLMFAHRRLHTYLTLR